jgi:hypothetical protein
MKKFILFIYAFLLASCHSTSYLHDLESTPFGIDYREDKWLLNEITCPESIKPKLTEIDTKGNEITGYFALEDRIISANTSFILQKT